MSEQPAPKKSKRTRTSRTPSTAITPTSTTKKSADEPVRGELVTQEGKLRQRVKRTTYTPEIGEAIIASVRGGMPIKMASQFHRVSYNTVMDWLARGENGENPYQAFSIEVRQAQATFVHDMIEAIKEAGISNAKQWTALMTLLERLYPEDFRRPTERSENLHLHGFVDGRIQQLVGGGTLEYTGE